MFSKFCPILLLHILLLYCSFPPPSSSQVSTHGYSQNQILVWKYPSLVQVAKLTGHSYRVLYLAMSPDGEAIVTGAGDETLRFWNVFSKARSQKVSSSEGVGVLYRLALHLLFRQHDASMVLQVSLLCSFFRKRNLPSTS